MSEKIDYKKEYRELYNPKAAPSLIMVPKIKFIMVDGTGDPNGGEYQHSVSLLYALSYAVKMNKTDGAAGRFDYVVPPLEGLWDSKEGTAFDLNNRADWAWTSIIRQPDFVTPEVFESALESVKKKKSELDVSKARLETYDEGLCVQLMHTGPYNLEPESIAKIARFISDNNLIDECGKSRRHHEIYLSDPRKASPETMKTILRHPVRRK